MVETCVLVMEHIAELIGQACGLTDDFVPVVMRVSKYPEVDIWVFDIVFQFHRESSIGKTTLKFGTLHQERWYMMRDNDFVLGCTVLNRLLDEL